MEDSVDSYPAEARNCCEGERETSAWECPQAAELKPMEWTDEKHSLYLKSMEATFVNHLYKLLSQQSQKKFLPGSKLLRHKPTGICAPSGQYKVCRYGSWSKINFVREEPEVNQLEESGVLLANPWIRHYRSSERKANRKLSSPCAKATTATAANRGSAHNLFQLHPEHSEDGNTEVTGQNFNDEDLEEQEQEIKKTGTPTGTNSNTDQVVPFENTVEDNDADDHGQT